MRYLLRLVTVGVLASATNNVYAQKTEFESVYECARLPSFISGLGLVKQVAIDTTIARLPGLVIRELAGTKRLYQAESWKKTGHVGSTVRDAKGNIYVIPIPSVALDTNPLEARNRVYKVDSESGEMAVFVELPLPKTDTQQNPFGTLGITLDCETNSLYVSSVAGSTPKNINGKIYQLSLDTGRIVDTYSGVDAIGLGVVKHGKTRRLYFGDARSSSVYSIALSNKGLFSRVDTPRYELSLLNIKNGDSTQVRKIKFVKVESGMEMQLDETEFAYRMGADTSRRYKTYSFNWQGKWMLKDMRFK